MGKIPCYIAYGKDGSVWFSSEMKTLVDDPGIAKYEIFPPGHYYIREKGETEGKMVRWYDPKWVTDVEYIPDRKADYTELRETVVDAVEKRGRFVVVLSGGLDSSHHLHRGEAQEGVQEHLRRGRPCIPSPSASRARPISSPQEGGRRPRHRPPRDPLHPEEALDALPDIVCTETFEQVRASVPMYLLSRAIKSYGFKMVLSGEGADELFGGYLYFHKAPSAAEFHKECARKTTRLHQWDVLRANKSTMAWGIEVRTPLLSQQVCDYAMNTDPEQKMVRMNETDEDGHPFLEKYLLRKAFDTPDQPYLPDEVLWRQKEQFSDGVGYDWVDGLQDYADKMVSDEQFANRAQRFPLNPPTTKEYYLLREIFEEHFVTGMENGDCAYATCPFGKSIACSTPEAVAWDPEWEKSVGDISGRAVKNVHVAGDEFDLKKDGAGKDTKSSAKEKKPAEAASVMAIIGGHAGVRGSVAVKAAKGPVKSGARALGGRGRAAVKSRFVGLRAVKASAVAFA